MAPILNIAGTPSTTQPSDPPQPGGTFTFLHSVEAAQIDPAQNRADAGLGADGVQASLVFDALLLEDWTTTEIVPRIATSLTSSDGVTWTLTLRPNVRFTDGSPFDAAAVQFNWNRDADPATGARNATTAQAIQSSSVVDSTTLRITLKAANTQFPRTVARSIPFIGSPSAIRSQGTQFGNAPVGAGPFVIKQWVRNSQMTLARNPSYWDAPRPYLDQVVVKVISDPSQRYNTWLSGGGDAANTSTDPSYGPKAEAAGAQLIDTTPPVGGLYYYLNNRKPPFNDPSIRNAVAMAADRARFNTDVFGGLNVVPTSVIRSPSPFADSSTSLPAYNPSAAQAAFDSYAASTGKPVEFTLTNTTASALYAEELQGQLSKYKNVKVNVEAIAATQLVPREQSGDFQAIINTTNAFDPDALFDVVVTGGATNFAGYSNGDVDKALNVTRSSQDPQQRKAAWLTVQQHLNSDSPLWWLSVIRNYVYFYPRVKDAQPTSVGLNWANLWIKH